MIQTSWVLKLQAWADQGGWILTGGSQKYQAHVEQYYGSCPVDLYPQYYEWQLADSGGTRKSYHEAVDDLQFSMKCIYCGGYYTKPWC